MRRDLESLVRLVREEVRIEGPDGGGISDLFVEEAINDAIGKLAEHYSIKDRIQHTTEEDKNKYHILDEGMEIEKILFITYDGKRLEGISTDTYLDMIESDVGPVRYWLLWGNEIVLTGEVEGGKELDIWITRPPKPLKDRGDEPELPYYTDIAIKQYAVSACHREMKDYERANYHYTIFKNELEHLLRRGVPQGQRNYKQRINDEYFPAVQWRRGGYRRTDEDPGGRGY